jgi:ArsR family transcriptional regulator
MQQAAPLLDSFSALSDPVRCRILWQLDAHELMVSELCAIFRLPQSTVSRHLRILGDAGWLTSRREGTSRYYALAPQEGGLAEIWRVTHGELAGRREIEQDSRRVASVLARRRETSRQFFATAADEWDRRREDLFGRHAIAESLVALVPSDWIVADLGCGTGALLPLVAPYVARVIGVDASDAMLAAARARAEALPNVDLRSGSLESLPIETGTLDAALMVLVLHHLPAPAAALAEAARVLRPGGRLLVIDMAPHDREEYRHEMGHVWLGFSEDHLRRLFAQAGLTSLRWRQLPAADDASGPVLFAATGVVRRPDL